MKIMYRLLFAVFLIASIPLSGMEDAPEVTFADGLECPICFTAINALNSSPVWYLECCSVKARRKKGIAANHKFICDTCHSSIEKQVIQTCPLCRKYGSIKKLSKYTIEEAPAKTPKSPANNDSFKQDRFALLCKEVAVSLKDKNSLSDPEINSLLNRHQYFDVSDINRAMVNVKPDIFAKPMFESNKRGAALFSMIIGTPTLVRWYITHCKYGRLIALESRIKNSQERILNFDFDMFDVSVTQLFTHNMTIGQLCSAVHDEQLRVTFRSALLSYEARLKDVHEKIIANYYYKPNIEFLESEADLVGQLNESSQRLLAIIERCKKESALSRLEIASGISVSALLGYYAWYARYENKWGIL